MVHGAQLTVQAFNYCDAHTVADDNDAVVHSTTPTPKLATQMTELLELRSIWFKESKKGGFVL